MIDHRAFGIIVVVIAGGALGIWNLIFRNAKPADVKLQSGTIAPERISAWFTVVVGAGMALGGLAFILAGLNVWLGLALVFMGSACAGFMAPSLTSMHKVNWMQDRIEGPSKMFGPTFGRARTSIMERYCQGGYDNNELLVR